MWIYIAILVGVLVAGIAAWKMMQSKKSEAFYSTMAPPKNFPEVVGLPLYDAKAYLSKYSDQYDIRVVGAYDESYREDLSTIYLVVDGSNNVTDVL